MLKSAALLPLAFVAAAFAQQPAPPMTLPTPALTLAQPVIVQFNPACPLSIAAHPHDSPQSTWVNSVEDAKLTLGDGARTGLRVSLASRVSRTMTHLTVEVLYRPYPRGIVPVTTQPTLQEHKTFELDANDAASLTRNLRVDGNVNIQRIRVLSVLYSDGTTWQASTLLNSCSVKPSHVILVGSR